MIDVVVDISHWQSNVDFEAMKAGGIIAVVHKATEGTSYVDGTYAERRREAEAAGVLWGAYHFLRPGNMAVQATHFVETAGEIDLYAADHEDAGVSLNDLKVFLREVERLTGKKAVIYSGHVIKEQLDGVADTELRQHPLWIAHYTSAAAPTWPTATWPQWWLWQHTESGRVTGVEGNVDRNRYDGTQEELFADWTGEEPLEPVVPAEPVVIAMRIDLPRGVGAVVTVNDGVPLVIEPAD